MAPVGDVQIIDDAYLTTLGIKMATDLDSRICLAHSFIYPGKNKIKNLRPLFRVDKAVSANAFFKFYKNLGRKIKKAISKNLKFSETVERDLKKS